MSGVASEPEGWATTPPLPPFEPGATVESSMLPVSGRSVPVRLRPPVRPLQNPRSPTLAYFMENWPPMARM